jgi:hypothetical protein
VQWRGPAAPRWRVRGNLGQPSTMGKQVSKPWFAMTLMCVPRQLQTLAPDCVYMAIQQLHNAAEAPKFCVTLNPNP